MAGKVLILGSGPSVLAARDWAILPFDYIVAINNAWAVRPEWTHHIHPEDFPPERRPTDIGPKQKVITAADYVEVQNRYGGFVYAGGTMAFTAAYWALGALRPDKIAFLGCDMVYPATGNTHFYGTGTADPLRDDISLRSLPAKARRFQALAARQGCVSVNLSTELSVLPYPRLAIDALNRAPSADLGQPDLVDRALRQEETAGYFVPSGRYWLEQDRFDPSVIDTIDSAWLKAFEI
jgi:hypothetical protein